MALLEHQASAIEHLNEWRVGALFMEPGTGKTRVAVEIVNRCDCDFVLWLGPLRTIRTEGYTASISDEVDKWGGFKVPSLYVGVESISASDRIYLETLAKVSQYGKVFCIVDESLKIKNCNAKRTKRIIEMGNHCRYRLILNGTPLSRNITDMWSQMEFLSPAILNMTHRKFMETFCRTRTVIHKAGGQKIYEKTIVTGYENLEYLHSLVRQYIYQCDLTLNVSQYFNVQHFGLDADEREVYNDIKGRYLDMDLLMMRNDNIFMEMTTELQHSYCCSEDKFRCVERIMERCVQSKVIIFCRFVRSREECARRFPLARVLSYQKESLGLNLQEYNVTIFFDKIWDYALRLQSMRRTYRTGQELECVYYDLTSDTGLDRMIDRNIDKKIDMLDYFKKMTIEQLRNEL